MKTFRSVLGKKHKDQLAPNDDTPPAGRASISGTVGSERDTSSGSPAGDDAETPVASAARLVKTFCTSEIDGSGAEVAMLPSLVEVAESSPAAAAECARHIRKFLYRENWRRPTVVYNAIMLMRILVENPGHTFTRNMDKKFVDAVREVLRNCQNLQSVQFLIDALQSFEAKSVVDEGLGRIVEMWQKERAKSKTPYPTHPNGQSQYMPPMQPMQPMLQMQPMQPMQSMPPMQPMQPMQPMPPMQPMRPYPVYQPYAMGHQPNNSQYEWASYGGGGRSNGGGGGHHSSRSLPRPQEVRKRLEEARTTAGVLADVVNTSSPAALLDHDLAGELSSRCRRATAQILDYLDAQNPIPDNTEMAHLLTVHEAVQQSLHHYYRAVLEARKQLGMGETRRSETGGVPAIEMTPAGKGRDRGKDKGKDKGKGTAKSSELVDGPGGSTSNGDAYVYGGLERGKAKANSNGSNGHGDDSNPRYSTTDLYSDSDSDSDGRMAAAIAASTAPGANSRPSQRYLNTDNPPAESSRSSSRVRPGYFGSASAAGQPSESSNGKSRQSGAATGSSAVYDLDDVSPIEPRDYEPAGGSKSGGTGASSAAIDSVAHAGGPVYRY